MIDYLTPLLEGTPAADWREQPALPPEEVPEQSLEVSGPAVVRSQGEDLSQTAGSPRDGESFGPERAARAFSEPEVPDRRTTGAAELEAKLRQSGRLSWVARTGGTAVTVALPEGETTAPAADLLALDRAVQRDARRYDRGFTVY